MSSKPDIQRPPLSAERIVATALDVIDAEGLDQLSIRRLGDALGVQGMAVYRHVRGKEDILDGVRRLLVEEFGDLLFVMANVGRHLGIDPETALRAANAKFTRRFAHIEARLAAQSRTPDQSTLAEMDKLWDEAKAAER